LLHFLLYELENVREVVLDLCTEVLPRSDIMFPPERRWDFKIVLFLRFEPG